MLTMKRKVYRAALVATICISLVSFAPTLGPALSPADSADSIYAHAASGTPPKGRYIIRPLVSDTRALSVKGSTKKNWAGINIQDCVMGMSQQFDISYDSKGRALIKNANSKKYLSVAGSKARKGASVVQAAKNSSTKQRWKFERVGKSNGYTVYRIKSAASGKYCMQLAGGKDVNAANIRMWSKNKSASEKFVLIDVKSVAEPAAAPAVQDGVYRIGSALSTSLSLSIPEDSQKNSGEPIFANSKNSLSQLFMFTYKNGYYQIRPISNGKSITLKNGNMLARAVAVQSKDSNKAYQRFRVTQTADGYYQFTAMAGGMALRVAEEKATWGKGLETWYPKGSPSEQFTLTRVDSIAIENGVYTISPYADSALSLAAYKPQGGYAASLAVNEKSREISQKFRIAGNPDGSYAISSVSTGLYLTASGESATLTEAPYGIPADTQLWYSKLCIGGMKFTSKTAGKAVQLVGSTGGYSIKLSNPSGSKNQAFLPELSVMFDDGQYSIESMSGAGSIEVAGASFLNLSNIQAGAPDGSGSQAWFVKANADGTVTIRNERSGKPLEAAAAASGANVRQNKSSGTSMQKWVLENNGDGSFRLRSAAAAGVYLDAGEPKDYAGKTNVRIAASTAGIAADTQRWRFVPVEVTNAGPAMPSDVADAIEQEARLHLGKPYIFGASGPNSFDCSGFIYYVMNHSGMKEMSRVTAQDIYDSCVQIPAESAKRGDLIFFKNTYKTDRTVTHVGIYLGGGKMIHAGSPVQISNVNTQYYKDHFYAYARIA
jgi:cell wall-associated NlpC family hydrolase